MSERDERREKMRALGEKLHEREVSAQYNEDAAQLLERVYMVLTGFIANGRQAAVRKVRLQERGNPMSELDRLNDLVKKLWPGETHMRVSKFSDAPANATAETLRSFPFGKWIVSLRGNLNPDKELGLGAGDTVEGAVSGMIIRECKERMELRTKVNEAEAVLAQLERHGS